MKMLTVLSLTLFLFMKNIHAEDSTHPLNKTEKESSQAVQKKPNHTPSPELLKRMQDESLGVVVVPPRSEQNKRPKK